METWIPTTGKDVMHSFFSSCASSKNIHKYCFIGVGQIYSKFCSLGLAWCIERSEHWWLKACLTNYECTFILFSWFGAHSGDWYNPCCQGWFCTHYMLTDIPASQKWLPSCEQEMRDSDAVPGWFCHYYSLAVFWVCETWLRGAEKQTTSHVFSTRVICFRK